MLKNKKGFTVMELVLAFSFVMVIALSMLKLLINYQNAAKVAALKQEFAIYQWDMISAIEKDFKKNVVRRMTNCSDSDAKVCIEVTFSNGISRKLKVVELTETVKEKERKFYAFEYDNVRYIQPEAYFTDIKNLDNNKALITKNTTMNRSDNYGGGAKNVRIYFINLPLYHEDLEDYNYGINLVVTGYGV